MKVFLVKFDSFSESGSFVIVARDTGHCDELINQRYGNDETFKLKDVKMIIEPCILTPKIKNNFEGYH